jgi:hypothetical protein
MKHGLYLIWCEIPIVRLAAFLETRGIIPSTVFRTILAVERDHSIETETKIIEFA